MAKRTRRLGSRRTRSRPRPPASRASASKSSRKKPARLPFSFREFPTLVLVEVFRLLSWVGLAGGIYLSVLGVMRVNGWESSYVPLSAQRRRETDEGGNGASGPAEGEEFIDLNCRLFELGDCILQLGSFIVPFERYLGIFGHELQLYVDHYGNYAILVIAGLLLIGSGLMAVGVATVDNLRAIRRLQHQEAVASGRLGHD